MPETVPSSPYPLSPTVPTDLRSFLTSRTPSGYILSYYFVHLKKRGLVEYLYHMSLLTEITRMKSIMGLTESKIDMDIQMIVDGTLQKLQDDTFEMGLGEMDELNEINSVDKIKVTNFVWDEIPVLNIDLYVNSDREDYDNIIAAMEYDIEKYIGNSQIIVDNIIDTRTLDPNIDL